MVTHVFSDTLLGIIVGYHSSRSWGQTTFNWCGIHFAQVKGLSKKREHGKYAQANSTSTYEARKEHYDARKQNSSTYTQKRQYDTRKKRGNARHAKAMQGQATQSQAKKTTAQAKQITAKRNTAHLSQPQPTTANSSKEKQRKAKQPNSTTAHQSTQNYSTRVTANQTTTQPQLINAQKITNHRKSNRS